MQEGDQIDPPIMKKLTDKMANLLGQILGLQVPEQLLSALRTYGSSRIECLTHLPDAVFFSGGVADGIYQRHSDAEIYGDIGLYFGASIRESRWFQSCHIIEPKETIRATVVGAGTCTTTVSGSTILFSSDVFPLQNAPVFRIPEQAEAAFYTAQGVDLVSDVNWFLEQSRAAYPVFAFAGKQDLSYSELKHMATHISSLWKQTMPSNLPLVIALEQDATKALGQCIQRQVQNGTVIVVDNIKAYTGEYIDFGKPIVNGIAIPIVNKTLIVGNA